MDITQLTSGQPDSPDAVGNSDARDTTQSGQQSDPTVGEVNEKYTQWRNDRRPYESGWFFASAMIRGLQNTRWNPVLNILESRKAPAHRSRDTINLILPKVKAKLSKFLKNRALPIVQSASTDHEDILNAQATTKVLEYLWDKLQLEEKYEEALLWAMQTGKSFWWFYWDETRVAQFKAPEDIMGQSQIHDLPEGDVGVEVGTAFELLVSDPGKTRLAQQPEIMRVKVRLTADVEKQFKLQPGSIESELKESDLFQYQKQIAQLGAKSITGMSANQDRNSDEKSKYTVVKEIFTAPNANYPEGRYAVVAGQKLLKANGPLPYGLATHTNPYPVVEFADTITAGQFWPTTLVDQLIPIQTQYNRIRNTVDENLKLVVNPKVFIPKQANVAKSVWTSEAGEKIYINWQPECRRPLSG
jgi:hypothetical protein